MGFFDVPTTRVRAGGFEVELPVKYRDASALTVLYPVDAHRAEDVLEPSGLTPVRFHRDHALLGVTWFEYRDTTIGPYNELSIALLVTLEQRSPRFPLLSLLRGNESMGAHVLHLPVTTEIARAGGCELYGYPKFLAEIPMRWTADALHASLDVDGGMVLSMQAPRPKGLELPMTDLTTFSLLDRRLLRTHITTSCGVSVQAAKGATLSIHSSDHPVAKTLLALGMPSSPAWILYSDPFRSLLPLGEPVLSHGERAA